MGPRLMEAIQKQPLAPPPNRTSVSHGPRSLAGVAGCKTAALGRPGMDSTVPAKAASSKIERTKGMLFAP